eukprot:TRINITY_DN12171_c0_g1_i1.p1 TRINITY_DN12171_c0_g1~~TRINITY_DN12171_c0_g1_i1.p1  ORF type:complete len:800 (-),score=231.13 TRINITY_DN12171_c0_g1_i1:15-2414(-)
MILRYSAVRRLICLHSSPVKLSGPLINFPRLMISSSFSSSRVQYCAPTITDKSGDTQEVKSGNKTPEPKKIQAMPPQLTKLIADSRGGGWPSLSNMSLLAQKCNLAGVSIDQVEEFLLAHFRSKSKKKAVGKKREPNFYSKHLLEKWQNNSKADDLEKFLKYLEENIYSQSDKIKLPVKRLEYCMAMWRLAAIIELCYNNSDEALKDIEVLADKVAAEDDTIKLILILSRLSYQKHFQDSDLPHLTRLIEIIGVKKDTPKSPSSLMPNLVLFVDLPQQLETLLSLNLEPEDRIRLQLSNCQACWKMSNFSASLDNLSAATEGFLDLSQSALATTSAEESFLSLTLPLVEVWREVVLTASQQSLTPAMDYMLTVSEMSAKRGTNLSLLPGYVMWLALKASPANKDLAAKLETRVTSRLRGGKFERCFIVEGMTQETKQFFVKDFVRRLLLDTVSVPIGTVYEEQEQVPANAEEISPSAPAVEAKSDLPSGISQQLLDISVMELASAKKVPEMIDMVMTEVRQGILPSAQTVEAVIQLLCDIGDLYNLDQLKRILPENSAEQESIYLATGKIKLRSVNSSWESGKKLESWIKLVEFYRETWSHKAKGSIQLQTGDTLIQKCYNYAKLYVEEAVLNSNNQLLPAIQAGSLKVATDFGDLALLLVYWEALFFGPQFEQQQVAETLLDKLPQLVDHIKIDLVLARCHRYRTESNYRRLMEIVLKHQVPPYTQSRVFEELLASQTRSCNIAGANETIKCAKSLDIKITADYLQDYLSAKQEVEAKAQSSVINKVKNFIFRTPNKK